MKRTLATVAAGLMFALAACSGSSADDGFSEKMTGTEHQAYKIADAELTDTDGQPYSLAADTSAPLTLVFFGYTNCPTECPIVMNTITSALQRLSDEERQQVEVVFVTTDPARDDATVLREYLDRYDSSFIGLNGELENIVSVADSMKIFVAEGEKLESGGYDLTGHATYVSGVQDGGATVIWNMDTTPTQLADDIHTLLP